MKQAGTGPSRRHIQGSKIAKGLPSVNLQYLKIENPKKVDREARRGLLTRAPGALKEGTLLKLSTFLSQLKGGRTLWRKNKFSKKVSQCRKTETGDFSGFLNTHSVVKHQKLEGGKIFIFGKNLTMPKKTDKGTLWDFSASILSQNSRKNEGGSFGEIFSEKKSHSAEKNWKGGPFGLARYCMLRGKTGKTFLVQFARPNGAISCNNIL